jgi:beta-galactosidase
MKLKRIFLIFNFLIVSWFIEYGFGQTAIVQSKVKQSLGSSNMPIGAYYYPEHWDSTAWNADLKKIADLGFEFTHFAEFAWAMIEPEEGNYQFKWLDEVIQTAYKNGLKVIMCTPTPTPPAWLTNKHPEILCVNEGLYTQKHGARLHVIQNHPIYLKYVEKIVSRLGARYGDHPAVAGWQLDNEPHFRPVFDYSDQAKKEFPVWLKKKYQTIDALNKAWGTNFWSQVYNNFEQIPLPNTNAGNYSNPHMVVDFGRFTADRLAEALRFQANLLRKQISDNQWITTNYAYYKFLPATDPFRNEQDLDFASHTMYLTTKILNDAGGPLASRLGSGMELSFSNELAKSVNGITGIMELQPGQINWGKVNSQPLPGAVRMWIWHTFALGDMFTCTYRFKQPLFGAEQYHKGILETDGETVSRGGREYTQAIEEIKSLKKQNKEVPSSVKSRSAALFWSLENMLDISHQPHHHDFDPWQFIYLHYNNLKRLGCPVTIVQDNDQLDPEVHPFLVVPAYQTVSRELIQKWEDYVENGGNLILTCRTAKKDPNGHLWKANNQEPIWDLIGAKIPAFDQLTSDYPGKVRFGEIEYEWYIWADWLEPTGDTEVLAKYSNQFYKDKAAAVTRNMGNGSVTYIGVYTTTGDLEREIFKKIFIDNNAVILDLPNYVFTEWRDGYWVTVNYSSFPAEVAISENAQIILGSKTVQPGGVTVWTE